MKMSTAHVLAVESDANFAAEMPRFMRPHGVEIMVTSSGIRALEIVAQLPFDLIILNIRLPDINGLEVCRRLKSDPRSRHLRVIFLSSEGNPQFRDIALRLGAMDYLAKPYARQEFKRWVLDQLDHVSPASNAGAAGLQLQTV